MMACSSASEGHLNVKAFREWHRQANILTEVLWNDVRGSLPPKKKKTDVPEGRLLILEGANVDKRHQEVLKCGPKYCVEPRLSIVDKLALTRDIARSVPEKEKERCVVECVDVVAKVEKLFEKPMPFIAVVWSTASPFERVFTDNGSSPSSLPHE
ncbi:hypothetical protein HPB52_007046 [Rhipicephalus sanguineus]|uniref:Uncharacterized protein n=1 Tax=Rhipicephalus sanguineus TaxID=34632 RepID=A0A9D4T350_RHISA|nr:hypothetical protein HPB52_007046 [Rhipicephalus sanguineus]